MDIALLIGRKREKRSDFFFFFFKNEHKTDQRKGRGFLGPFHYFPDLSVSLRFIKKDHDKKASIDTHL